MGSKQRRVRVARQLSAAALGLAAAACGTTVPPPYGATSGAAVGVAPGGAARSNSALNAPVAGGAGPGVTLGGGSPNRNPLGGGGPSTAVLPGGQSGPQPPGSASTNAQLPPTGRGWDAKSIYLGFGIETDASKAGGSLGLNSLNFGDMKGMANALTNYVNNHGGLFGRKLVPVFYDASTARGISNPDQVAQEACTTWTQDRPVAVILITTPILDNQTLFDCAAHHDTPVVAHSEFAFTEADVQQLQSYLTLTDNLSFDRLADPWLQRLTAMGYFHGWNTATGTPGPTPTKVGIIYQSSSWADHAFNRLVAALKARHMVPDVATFQGYYDASLQSAVLRFRQDQVTHVFLDFAASITFPTAAEQQRYRPRYAVNSQDEVAVFLQGNSPPAQLRGALGIGWLPPSDVGTTEDPNASPGAPRCARLMRAAGVALTPRQAYYQAMVDCDLTFLSVQAAVAGGGLSTAALARGIAAAEPRFPYAATFGGTSNPALIDKVGAFRDLGFVTSCGCFQYLSSYSRSV